MNDWSTAKSTISELTMYDDAFVRTCIQKRMELLGHSSSENYLKTLELDQAERSSLLHSLQVSYSEFFRNPLTFAVLEKVILPELIQRANRNNRSQLRIWSMACASGQELYSLAILLEEVLELQQSNLQYQLFGSDSNESAILSANIGWFEKSALGNVTSRRLDRWFVKEREGFRIKDELKKHVHFSVFDLNAEVLQSPSESIFGGFDLLFCANILFYYHAERQERILQKATSVLSKGGYLITGEVERCILQRKNFKEHTPNSAIFSL